MQPTVSPQRPLEILLKEPKTKQKITIGRPQFKPTQYELKLYGFRKAS